MKIPKRLYPNQYFHRTISTNAQIESLPFYVKEFGFCNDKKFVVGQANNYSEYLLLYPITGVTRFTKNSNTQFIQQNNIVVSSCNTTLTFTRATKEWEFVYVIVTGSHAKFFYNNVRTWNCVLPTTPMSKLLDSFLEITSLSFKNAFADSMKASCIIHNIFLELYNITNNIAEAKGMTPVQETVVNQAIKYISQNYKNELDVDTICSKVSFSKYYFCKLFKQHTGVTIHQYVNEFRVNKSKELLSYSKLSISAVARTVGFENPLTYSRAFEKYMHMTPSEYRRNF